ncbi:MAG: molybdate ABC transporter substrate-binding protein [Deltaproteobacteria bacterium]|nr:molybdate ABC transporter substrate-binding protein [Deltaproteobacteria bacterium]MCW5801839.1 molybdate ABC transporter substrate-binding protein [Deltaproteobacteria bacterium]
MIAVVRACVCLALLASCSGRSSGKVVRIGAASDLQKAFEEVGKEFQARTGIAPEFTFSSSGLLAKQIENGEGYFLFASADKSYVERVIKAERCDAASARMYARGRLVVWTPQGKTPPRKITDLTEERFKKISIANPDHAPYGRAARQAMQKLGIWDAIKDRIVEGDSVSQAMLFARKGDVDAAIVALSLAIVTSGGESLTLDESLHDPLDQQLVVCGAGEEADRARQFSAFLETREGREIMSRYGFKLPEDRK